MRLYNGCPDDELQAVWDEQDRVKRLIKETGHTVTWFPAGSYYVGFDKDSKPVTKDCRSVHEVLQEITAKRNPYSST